MVAEELFYTEEHIWAKIDGDIAIIGITDYAQKHLGEIIFVELPDIGKELQLGDQLCFVESSKVVSDVYSPVTGKVTKVNSKLALTPELINEDCYGGGWICEIEITDCEFANKLMKAEQYEEYLKGVN